MIRIACNNRIIKTHKTERCQTTTCPCFAYPLLGFRVQRIQLHHTTRGHVTHITQVRVASGRVTAQYSTSAGGRVTCTCPRLWPPARGQAARWAGTTQTRSRICRHCRNTCPDRCLVCSGWCHESPSAVTQQHMPCNNHNHRQTDRQTVRQTDIRIRVLLTVSSSRTMIFVRSMEPHSAGRQKSTRCERTQGLHIYTQDKTNE